MTVAESAKEASGPMLRGADRFDCSAIPGLAGTVFYVAISCPGYAEERSREFTWTVGRISMQCHPVDVGVLRVRQKAP